MPIAGVIAASQVGWPAAFYLYGTIGLTWSIVWLFCGASSPATSRFISEEEKKWILYELGDNDKREVIF